MLSYEFFITALIVVLIPGTGVVYTVAVGLGHGRNASFFAAIGCTLGIVPHLLASSLGLAALLNTSALLFQAVKYVGAAYLLYLAVMTLRDKGPIRFDQAPLSLSMRQITTAGFLINILNPKLSIFFLAFLPQFIPASTTSPLLAMMSLGGIFMLMTLIVFTVYGIFAAHMRARVLASDTVMTWMRRGTAATFAALGARLVFSDQ